VLGLVKRVEIHKDEIVVVFRIDPQPGALASENPNDSDDGVKSMQHCTRRKRPALRRALIPLLDHTAIHDAAVQIRPDQPDYSSVLNTFL
jgi:site-specific DNA recombinase